jgi:nucleotide-binding universal stress UspA family protein
MGTHGRTGLPRLLLGSVAERVVRMAKCPVISVPGPAETETTRTLAS